MESPDVHVTVAMAAFNGERYIGEAVTSVLKSHHRDFTLLIVDDASSDSTRRVLSTIHDSRIVLVQHNANVGLVATRNEILQTTSSELLFWLDQDDIMYPSRLEEQIEFMVRHPDIGILGSWTKHREMISTTRTRTRRVKFPVRQCDIRAWSLFTNPFSFNTLAFRLSILREADLVFRPEFGNALDYDIVSRAADLIQVANLPRVLGEYRIHAEQTSQGPESGRMFRASARIRSETLDRNFGPNATNENLTALLGSNDSDLLPGDLAAFCLEVLKLNEVNQSYSKRSLKFAAVHALCSLLIRRPKLLRIREFRQALRQAGVEAYVLERIRRLR